jgi:hypothetical protein
MVPFASVQQDATPPAYNPNFHARTHALARAPMISMYPNTSMPQPQTKKALNKMNGHAAASADVAPTGGRRIQVRRSGVHGKGVFALSPIAKGEVIIEYKGEVITWREALRRHPHNPDDPDHTFYFHIDDKRVIDANVDGNAARWINHACKPNCEADEVEGRIFIKSLRKLKVGEELSYDYGLVIDGRQTRKLKKQFKCLCGAKRCRGTMLAPKR